ncbi:LysR family transcriptional regulator [Cryomorpha ignava]|uniref:LysR family transcriptional regulator n=1 Tax=Cryomorpha ignava TaxID=101383 RepID=A0A7K3WVQ0_9FLAO|nr:LysR family transcriptional regulator [Cryomorpha ignava]NEN25713.1 LysR family transcriptional regulator [Cryomorpha ignava]
MDHKLKIFKEVAINKSFTKAAENLFLSQPAISKTIKNLEQQYGKALFVRQGNHIDLTDDGKLFLAYTNKLLDIYSELTDAFAGDQQKLPGQLKIGASTTIGQYVIPALVAGIQKDNPEFRFQLICGNTEDVQNQLLNGLLDFGIVEGDNHNKRLHYERFVKDELVLVTAATRNGIPNTIQLNDLEALTFVEREHGSGTREVIGNALKKRKVKPLNIIADLGSTESIKSYLRNSNHYAFLSIHSINQELAGNKLRVVEVTDFQIERWFYFVSRQGYQSKSSSLLQNLLLEGYNQK